MNIDKGVGLRQTYPKRAGLGVLIAACVLGLAGMTARAESRASKQPAADELVLVSQRVWHNSDMLSPRLVVHCVVGNFGPLPREFTVTGYVNRRSGQMTQVRREVFGANEKRTIQFEFGADISEVAAAGGCQLQGR